MNVGLAKRGVRVTAFWRLEKVLKVSALSFDAGLRTSEQWVPDLMENSRCRTNHLKSNLMHNSFILQQYVCYTTILNMFRAARCSSSGGQIVSPQPLVSSPSVNSRTVCRWRAEVWLWTKLWTCLKIDCRTNEWWCRFTVCKFDRSFFFLHVYPFK